MAHFNFRDYLDLQDNQVLRLKIDNQKEDLFIKKVSTRVLQAYQADFTPINSIMLNVLNDFELYKIGQHTDKDSYILEIEPSTVTEFELIEIN